MTRAYSVGVRRRVADYNVVRMRYEAGETCQEIGDSLGVSRQRVAQIIKDIARPGGRLPVEGMRIDLHAEEIEKALRSGQSGSSVAQSLGVSATLLRRKIKVKAINPPKRTIHGTVQRYNCGCRCEDCIEVHRIYRTEQSRRRARRMRGAN